MKEQEDDLVEKLTWYRNMPGWCIENEAMFIDQLASGMVAYLVNVDGYAYRAANARVKQFVENVTQKMKEMHRSSA
jgi:hypothetical protein